MQLKETLVRLPESIRPRVLTWITEGQLKDDPTYRVVNSELLRTLITKETAYMVIGIHAVLFGNYKAGQEDQLVEDLV